MGPFRASPPCPPAINSLPCPILEVLDDLSAGAAPSRDQEMASKRSLSEIPLCDDIDVTSSRKGAAAPVASTAAADGGSSSGSSRDVWISVEGSRQLSSDVGTGHKITAVASGEVDASAILQETILDRIPESRRVTVQFSGVSGWVPAGIGAPGAGESVGKRLWRKLASIRGKEEGGSGSDSQPPVPPGKRQVGGQGGGGVQGGG